MKPKPIEFWAVVFPEGDPAIAFADLQRKGAIRNWLDGTSNVWDDFRTV